jgi:hypothetical protein
MSACESPAILLGYPLMAMSHPVSKQSGEGST